MSKVVHLSSVHTPFDIRIFVKECRTLANNGFHVTFIVPNDRDENRDGVYIRAIPKVSGRIKRMTRTAWSVFRAALMEKGDIYHFHDPELIPVGLLLKLFGKKVIYDVHEDLPRQILTKHWIHYRFRKLAASIAEGLEAIGAKVFDGIIAVTPEIASRFPKERTVLVQNYPIRNELASYQEQTNNLEENIVVYIGSISIIRGAKEMLEAVSLLPNSLQVRLVLAGSFSPPSLQSELMKLEGWKKVQFVGWQSREQVRQLLMNAKVGLVPFHPVPNHVNSQPNKLFEYMSAAVPVIASDFPKWQEIVNWNQCGILVNPQNPYEIAEKIKFMIENPTKAKELGKNGREAVQKYYVWDMEAEKMLALYQTLIGGVKERKTENVFFKSGDE